MAFGDLHEEPPGGEAPPRVLVALFDGFELLDVFGPAEILGHAGCEVVFAAQRGGSFEGTVEGTAGCAPGARSGAGARAEVVAELSLEAAAAQRWDLLLVPGGRATRKLVSRPGFLAQLTACCAAADRVASVCTGSALLAACGALRGRAATTNKRAWDWVLASSPGARAAGGEEGVCWQPRARWVCDRGGSGAARGKLVATSSGVAAGMDLAVWLASDLLGAGAGEEAARRCEYMPSADPDCDPFARPT